MARERFVRKNFSEGSRAIIWQADQIMREFAAAGYKLTLRQLYYQFVARDLLANKQTEYKRLGSIINDARLAGKLDWDHIEDRTRNLESIPMWSSPQDILEAVAQQYKEDLWRNQSHRPEVWIEKEALVGVIEPICRKWRVPFVACRGYFSQSEAYAAGKRFLQYDADGKQGIVFHLGDHDPSGMDMTRDNLARLDMFTGGLVEVKRLALNMSQIDEYSPPPNPAKVTDSRFRDYQSEYGDDSWELDALQPQVISNLIEDAINAIRDPDQWDDDAAIEAQNRQRLQLVSDDWDNVIERLENPSEDV